MSAEYTLHRTPSRDGAIEEQPLHARFAPRGTISTDQLIELLSEQSTFSPADLKGALRLISDGLASKLKEGYNVELDELGFYSLSLECRPVQNPEEIRSQSVSFHHVTFRNSKTLTNKLRNIRFTRKEGQKPCRITLEQRRENAIAYLQRNPESGLSRRTYMSLNGCTRYMALMDLDRLVGEGILSSVGNGNVKVYVLKQS